MLRGWAVLSLVLAIACAAGPASAEREVRGTIGLYLDTGSGNDLSRAGVTKIGDPFELVVTIDVEARVGAVVFQMTELNLLYPGVFKVSTRRYNDTPLELGRNDIGEYAFALGGCVEAGSFEILRVGYADVNGDLPENVLLYIDGVPDDEIHAPDLDGAPGFVDCDEDEYYALAPEPWAEAGFDPTLIDGVTTTDGLLVLNPSQIVPVEGNSFSALKARF